MKPKHETRTTNTPRGNVHMTFNQGSKKAYEDGDLFPYHTLYIVYSCRLEMTDLFWAGDRQKNVSHFWATRVYITQHASSTGAREGIRTAFISHCSQTVPSRCWNVPSETFMHHNFLQLSSSEGLTRARVFTDGMFHEAYTSMHWLDHATVAVSGLGQPPMPNHCTSNTDLDALYTILINRVYIAQGLCSHAAHPDDGLCPAFSPYSKSLIPRSVCKQP